MRYITINLDDEEFEQLSMAKGDRTWREYIMNHRRRRKLQKITNDRE